MIHGSIGGKITELYLLTFDLVQVYCNLRIGIRKECPLSLALVNRQPGMLGYAGRELQHAHELRL